MKELNERTLVLIKPDAVKKGIVGKIITRLEEAGLKIIALKMVWADEEFARNHYFLDENWAKEVFKKAKKTMEKEGKKFPYKNHMEYGKKIQNWNAEILKSGPTIAIVLEAPHAIEITRKIIGPTEPRKAPPGTIRGDFASHESYEFSNLKNRAVKNLIHASDSPKSAKREIALWFDSEEIHSNYKTAHELLFL
jgi:nucleoside-diphosphate kinase